MAVAAVLLRQGFCCFAMLCCSLCLCGGGWIAPFACVEGAGLLPLLVWRGLDCSLCLCGGGWIAPFACEEVGGSGRGLVFYPCFVMQSFVSSTVMQPSQLVAFFFFFFLNLTSVDAKEVPVSRFAMAFCCFPWNL